MTRFLPLLNENSSVFGTTASRKQTKRSFGKLGVEHGSGGWVNRRKQKHHKKNLLVRDLELALFRSLFALHALTMSGRGTVLRGDVIP